MPSSKTKDSKKSQSERFIEAAREAGASEDEAVFNENLRRLTQAELMSATQQYESPDRKLRLQMMQDGDDVVLSFGFAWHTHADLLAASYHVEEGEAVARFVREIQTGQAVIAIYREGSAVTDIRVVEDRDAAIRSKPDNQTLETRLWDGTPV